MDIINNGIYDSVDRIEAVNGSMVYVGLTPESQKELTEQLYKLEMIFEKERSAVLKSERRDDLKAAAMIGLLVFAYTLLMSIFI